MKWRGPFLSFFVKNSKFSQNFDNFLTFFGPPKKGLFTTRKLVFCRFFENFEKHGITDRKHRFWQKFWQIFADFCKFCQFCTICAHDENTLFTTGKLVFHDFSWKFGKHSIYDWKHRFWQKSANLCFRLVQILSIFVNFCQFLSIFVNFCKKFLQKCFLLFLFLLETWDFRLFHMLWNCTKSTRHIFTFCVSTHFSHTVRTFYSAGKFCKLGRKQGLKIGQVTRWNLQNIFWC